MSDCAYLYPASVEEAVAILEQWQGAARIIAGGTDLMLDRSRGGVAPRCLVDITRIPGLGGIEVGERYITVGAAATFAQLAAHPFLREHVPALAAAAASVGAAPIQVMATWAGNIAQAMPAADGGVAAVALDATARVVGIDGAVWTPVEQLYAGVKASAVDSTRQMISHLRFARPPARWGCAWRRAGRRPSLVLPVLNCAVTLQLAEARAAIAAATVALGPVAALPFRARAAEAYLIGRTPANEVFAEAARLARAASDPRDSPLRATRAYRLELIPVLVSAALAAAAERAGAT